MRVNPCPAHRRAGRSGQNPRPEHVVIETSLLPAHVGVDPLGAMTITPRGWTDIALVPPSTAAAQTGTSLSLPVATS